MPTIQKADPRAKRRAIAALLVTVFLGGALLLALDTYRPEYEAWVQQRADWIIAHPGVTTLIVFAGSSPIIALALYMWRQGAATVRCARFPPPKLPVVRDTLVLSGQAAVRRGRVIQSVAGLLIGLCCVSALVFWWTLRRLFGAG